MRLAYIATGYPYASHTFIRNEVEGLRRLGAEVETFTVQRSKRSEVRSEADRAAFETTYAIRPPRLWHFVRAHARALVGSPGRYGHTLRVALAMGGSAPRDSLWHVFYFVQAVVLWNECRRRHIRHVHAHFANVSSDLALLAAELGGHEQGWSWSFTMHGPTEFYDVVGHRLPEKVSRAAMVVCISDFARSQLMGLTPAADWSKLQVVHCGIDTVRFAPSCSADEGAQAGAVRVLNVGRLVPVKGQAVLLHAAADLRNRGVDVELRIGGSGPEAARLSELAADLGLSTSTHFLGALGHDTVRAEMARADVFCLPSFAEGVPVVLMEAMASGLPVVASRVMGIPELVEEGVTGRLVSPGAAEPLADALEELAGALARRRAMGACGRARVVADFEHNRSAAELHELFVRCVTSTNRTRVSR